MLFSEKTPEIKFNQTNDLKIVVDHLKGFIFQEGDSSKIHEFFCLYIFLVGSFKIERLSLPVRIISRESPDFTIIYEDQKKKLAQNTQKPHQNHLKQLNPNLKNILNEPHFGVKKENTLFIEDDSSVDFVKTEDGAIQILKQKYNQTIFSENHIFDNVHIFSNCTLIYNIFGECIKIGLRKKELPNIQLTTNFRGL